MRRYLDVISKAWIEPAMRLCSYACFFFQEANGYMPRVRDQGSRNLKIVFGAMPPNLTPEYKEVERYTTHLVRRRLEQRERQLWLHIVASRPQVVCSRVVVAGEHANKFRTESTRTYLVLSSVVATQLIVSLPDHDQTVSARVLGAADGGTSSRR